VNAPGAPFAVLPDDVLCAALVSAQATVFASPILKDPAGFALAIAVHAKIAGPDPAVLRERALAVLHRQQHEILGERALGEVGLPGE
jgi:hypothetical protein